MADILDIGLFDDEPGSAGFSRASVVRFERHRLRAGSQVVRFVTDRAPAYAGIDPYNLYIERDGGDNVAPVDVRGSGPGAHR